MHPQLSAILKCIRCNSAGLKLSEIAQSTLAYEQVETIENGTLVCTRCQTVYTIQHGIVNFLPRRASGISLGQFTNHNRLVAWGYERFWRPKALSLLGGRDWPPREELDTIVSMLQSPQPQRLTRYNDVIFYLDQACSTAFYARALVNALDTNRLNVGSHEGHVVALDNSWPMLKEAREWIEQNGMTGRISLVRANAENLPFIDKAFAGVANGGSLNEFQHPQKALEEAARVLDPYGQAAFMVQMYAKSSLGLMLNKFIETTSGLHFFKLDQLNQLFANSNLTLHNQQSDGLITISALTPSNHEPT